MVSVHEDKESQMGDRPEAEETKGRVHAWVNEHPATASVALISAAGFIAKITFAPDLAWTLILAPVVIAGTAMALYAPFVAAVATGVFRGMRAYDIYNDALRRLLVAQQRAAAAAESCQEELSREEIEQLKALYDADSPSRQVN